MKRWINAMVLSVLCALISGCGRNGISVETDGELSILVATDLHYLSPELTDYGTGFMRMVENGDGKPTQYTPELLDAFIQTVLDRHPAALILSGDLSFNGERESHAELAKKLEVLEGQGIPVLVIPGNHDIDNPFAARYEGESVSHVDGVSAEEFQKIYGKLAYGNAAARAEDSLSFLYELSDRLWILLLDSNPAYLSGAVPEATLTWAEAQLERAREKGAAVITVTHQNVLSQNGLLSKGFVLENHDAVEALLRGGAVTLNLSGHVHIQHISEKEGLMDIATGSLSVSPNQYGILTVKDSGEFTYKTEPVAVKDWNGEKGGGTFEGQEFSEMTRAYFDRCTRKKMKKELADLPLVEEQKEAMTALAVEINGDYFAGRLKGKGEITDTEAWRLWETEGSGLFFKKYMDSMLEDDGNDENRAAGSLKR